MKVLAIIITIVLHVAPGLPVAVEVFGGPPMQTRSDGVSTTHRVVVIVSSTFGELRQKGETDVRSGLAPKG